VAAAQHPRVHKRHDQVGTEVRDGQQPEECVSLALMAPEVPEQKRVEEGGGGPGHQEEEPQGEGDGLVRAGGLIREVVGEVGGARVLSEHVRVLRED